MGNTIPFDCSPLFIIIMSTSRHQLSGGLCGGRLEGVEFAATLGSCGPILQSKLKDTWVICAVFRCSFNCGTSYPVGYRSVFYAINRILLRLLCELSRVLGGF